jgi:hypothetical protein
MASHFLAGGIPRKPRARDAIRCSPDDVLARNRRVEEGGLAAAVELGGAAPVASVPGLIPSA